MSKKRTAANAGTEPRSAASITTSARKALDRLTPERRAYVQARVSRANREQAAQAAGVCRAATRRFDNEQEVQSAFRELMRSAFPMEEMVDLIVGGAHANIPGTNFDDWRTRLPYIKMGSEYSGYVDPNDNTPPAMVVKIEVVGNNNPSSVRLPPTLNVVEVPKEICVESQSGRAPSETAAEAESVTGTLPQINS